LERTNSCDQGSSFPSRTRAAIRLFHGEIDDRVPLHHAEHLVRVIPSSHLTVYPGEGHMIIFERAEDILGALGLRGIGW
jgi:pimeloyl-ACP methyl ester carboxylesterase